MSLSVAPSNLSLRPAFHVDSGSLLIASIIASSCAGAWSCSSSITSPCSAQFEYWGVPAATASTDRKTTARITRLSTSDTASSANCPSLKEIRDQANCGSCWAFGSVEAMTDRICIGSNGTKKTHLSAEDVTSCDILGDMGCNGGVPSSVYSYYKTFGIVDGGNYGDKSGCYSYQLQPCAHHTVSTKYPNCTGETKTPKCARKCVDNGKEWRASKVHGADGGYSVCKQGAGNCAEQMAQEIYQNGPITGMFFVHQSFVSYKSGVYKSKWFHDPMLGGHAIKIMGFGTEGGVPYWLVANSWNEDWGDHGYFKIKRGSDTDMIENAIINGGPVAGTPPKAEESLLVV